MSLPAQNIKIINNTVLKFQTQRQRLAHLHLSKVNSHTKSNLWNLSMLSQCQPPQLKAHPSCHSYKVTTAQSSCTSTIAKICYYSQLTNCHSISGQSVSPCIISLHTSKSIRFSRHRDSFSPKQIQENPLRAKFKTPSQDVFLVTRMGENGVYG